MLPVDKQFACWRAHTRLCRATDCDHGTTARGPLPHVWGQLRKMCRVILKMSEWTVVKSTGDNGHGDGKRGERVWCVLCVHYTHAEGKWAAPKIVIINLWKVITLQNCAFGGVEIMNRDITLSKFIKTRPVKWNCEKTTESAGSLCDTWKQIVYSYLEKQRRSGFVLKM